jgi:hypothetical protein
MASKFGLVESGPTIGRLRSFVRTRRPGHSTTPGEYMAAIAAERVVRHLERAGFVVMKRPPEIGAAALGRGHER